MADVQAPPTYAEVVLIDERTKEARFNPIWLKWFIDIVQTLNTGGGTTIAHNSTTGLQGGTANEYYHLTAAQRAVVAALGTIASQAANNVAITGGALDGTAVGGTTPAAGTFTNLLASTIFRPPSDAGALQTAVAVYAGNGAPSNANGANGDFYFRGDGAAGTFIYHKAAGAWTAFV